MNTCSNLPVRTIQAVALSLLLVMMGCSSNALGTPLYNERKSGGEKVLPEGFSPLPSLSGLVNEVKPAVVNIYTTQIMENPMLKRREQPWGLEPFPEDPFHEFFERFFGAIPEGELKRRSLGSGFIISDNGYLLTNYHVVLKAQEIKVKLENGEEFDAKVVGGDKNTDVALLKITNDKSLPFVYVGDSDGLQVGDWVLAIGNPFGLSHTVTAGIVSAKDRQIGQGPYDNFLQTDASINPGNSGGPLFDMYGNVIGINTAIVAQGQGIGFAVPINLVKSILPQLYSKGKVERGWLGVGIQEVTPDIAKSMGLPTPSGALVSQIFPGSPAEKGGLEVGDIIVAFEDQAITKFNHLTFLVAEKAPGTKIRLTVLRNGERKTLSMVLGQRDEERAAGLPASSSSSKEEEKAHKLGVVVRALNADETKALGVVGLMVTSVDPSGAAAGKLQTKDVIIKVNGRKVTAVADLTKQLDTSKQKAPILFLVRREGSNFFTAIRLSK